MYDCIIGRGLYNLTNIHQDVFLPVVIMPCTQIKMINFSGKEVEDKVKSQQRKYMLHEQLKVNSTKKNNLK